MKGFQVHHILPEYLGKMLGYTTQQMAEHPGTFISQWSHTGALNPAAMHKAISLVEPSPDYLARIRDAGLQWPLTYETDADGVQTQQGTLEGVYYLNGNGVRCVADLD